LLAGLMHPLSAILIYWLLPDREFEKSRVTPVGVSAGRLSSM
jgi:hypothetical protein